MKKKLRFRKEVKSNRVFFTISLVLLFMVMINIIDVFRLIERVQFVSSLNVVVFGSAFVIMTIEYFESREVNYVEVGK